MFVYEGSAPVAHPEAHPSARVSVEACPGRRYVLESVQVRLVHGEVRKTLGPGLQDELLAAFDQQGQKGQHQTGAGTGHD